MANQKPKVLSEDGYVTPEMLKILKGKKSDTTNKQKSKKTK